MAAEKHLKAVLIDANRNKFDDLESVELQKESIENIVKSYSHNFRKMIKDVSAIYVREMGAPFLPDEHLGFKSEKLIAAMYEGYMETRYPSVLPTSRHFPTGVTNGMFHSPLGSSFFTDFIEVICIQCWTYLNTKKLNTADIIAKLEEHFEESAGFEHFKATVLGKIANSIGSDLID
jgi:hypothetical protein